MEKPFPHINHSLKLLMSSSDKKSWTIEDRVGAVFGVLSLREAKTDMDLASELRSLELILQQYRFCENYYLIAHHETETNHIHFVIEFSGTKRLKTVLNDFERFGYNREAVSIRPLGFLNSAIKYMIHYDESSIEDGKLKYSLDQIVSNMSYEYLETLLLMDDDRLSFDRLVEICTDCDFNIMKIGTKLGLDTYRVYRQVIRDICDQEYRLRLIREKSESVRTERLRKELPF